MTFWNIFPRLQLQLTHELCQFATINGSGLMAAFIHDHLWWKTSTEITVFLDCQIFAWCFIEAHKSKLAILSIFLANQYLEFEKKSYFWYCCQSLFIIFEKQTAEWCQANLGFKNPGKKTFRIRLKSTRLESSYEAMEGFKWLSHLWRALRPLTRTCACSVSGQNAILGVPFVCCHKLRLGFLFPSQSMIKQNLKRLRII